MQQSYYQIVSGCPANEIYNFFLQKHKSFTGTRCQCADIYSEVVGNSEAFRFLNRSRALIHLIGIGLEAITSVRGHILFLSCWRQQLQTIGFKLRAQAFPSRPCFRYPRPLSSLGPEHESVPWTRQHSIRNAHKLLKEHTGHGVSANAIIVHYKSINM